MLGHNALRHCIACAEKYWQVKVVELDTQDRFLLRPSCLGWHRSPTDLAESMSSTAHFSQLTSLPLSQTASTASFSECPGGTCREGAVIF